MRVVITGASGQLGQELQKRFGDRCAALGRDDYDLAAPNAAARMLDEYGPSVVINTAAYTKVDLAETEADRCWAVNADGVLKLAQACNDRGARLVHISSDYVFAGYSGSEPRCETAPISPRGVYASSKYAGELFVRQFEEHLVVRTCGLYALNPGAINFVATMLRVGSQRKQLRVVDDQQCAPTYVKHFAAALVHLIESKQRGLFNLANSGSTTWNGFAKKIFELAGMNDVEVEAITTAEYGAASPRPAYSVLDLTKYDSTGGPRMPSWDEALADYFADRSAQ